MARGFFPPNFTLTCFMFSSKVVASKIFILYQNIIIFLTMSGQILVNRLGWSRLFGNLVQNLVALNTADITPDSMIFISSLRYTHLRFLQPYQLRKKVCRLSPLCFPCSYLCGFYFCCLGEFSETD